jgi:excisionase family DNA binding protein
LTGRLSLRLVSGATIRVPSVGFAFATSTIAASTGPDAGLRCGGRLGFGFR